MLFPFPLSLFLVPYPKSFPFFDPVALSVLGKETGCPSALGLSGRCACSGLNRGPRGALAPELRTSELTRALLGLVLRSRCVFDVWAAAECWPEELFSPTQKQGPRGPDSLPP